MTKILIVTMVLLQMFAQPTDLPRAGRGMNPERIIGKWITEKKDLIVEVYKSGEEFKGRVLWFDNKEDLGKPLNTITDSNNPDPLLRNRKILGLEVVKLLRYNQASNSWEDGLIYDSSSGREWSSFAFFTDEGHLRVKGYWQFKFICKSMDFVSYKGQIK